MLLHRLRCLLRSVALLVLLPLPRRFFVLASDHVRVDLLRRPHGAMPQASGHGRQGNAFGKQDGRVGMTEEVECGALGLRDLQAFEQ